MSRPVTLALVAIALSACSAPLEFADWRLPIPDGTPIKEYAPVAHEERDPAAVRLVDDPRPPFPDALKQSRIDRARGDGDAAISVDDFDWPPYTAVGSLHTDGAGNLYVFPEVPMEGDEPPVAWPVDVYSPAGDFLAAGFVPHTWSYARGDYVYGLRRDERDEMVVVRYRLELSHEEELCEGPVHLPEIDRNAWRDSTASRESIPKGGLISV